MMPLDHAFKGGENLRMGKAAASSPTGNLPERRFSGTLGDDYELWRLARPFLGEVHEIVVHAVRSLTQARDRPLRALDIAWAWVKARSRGFCSPIHSSR
jgi:hypothetical protein